MGLYYVEKFVAQERMGFVEIPPDLWLVRCGAWHSSHWQSLHVHVGDWWWSSKLWCFVTESKTVLHPVGRIITGSMTKFTRCQFSLWGSFQNVFFLSFFLGGGGALSIIALLKSPLQQVDAQNTQGGAFVPLSRPRLWFLPGLLFSVYVVNQLAWSLLCPPLVQGAPVSCRVQVALGPDFKSGRTSTDRGRTNWNRWEVSFDLGWGIWVHLLRPSLFEVGRLQLQDVDGPASQSSSTSSLFNCAHLWGSGCCQHWHYMSTDQTDQHYFSSVSLPAINNINI